MAFHSTKKRYGGKLTPARRLLFQTGHDLHEFIVRDFMLRSPWGKYVYANWSCRDYLADPENHDILEKPEIADNVITNIDRRCRCGRFLDTHNEIDLEIPQLMVVGHPDMIVKVGDKFYIYEFKTIDRRDMSFDDIEFVLAEHRLQVSFYYRMMRAMGLNVSKKLRVLYIDRSNSKLWGGFPFKEIICEPEQPEFLNPFRIKLELVSHGVKTGHLPDRICPNAKCERARGCDFAVLCWEHRGKKAPEVEMIGYGKPNNGR
jgi:hypothetical protein